MIVFHQNPTEKALAYLRIERKKSAVKPTDFPRAPLIFD
jgi:hypothetical protein